MCPKLIPFLKTISFVKSFFFETGILYKVHFKS